MVPGTVYFGKPQNMIAAGSDRTRTENTGKSFSVMITEFEDVVEIDRFQAGECGVVDCDDAHNLFPFCYFGTLRARFFCILTEKKQKETAFSTIFAENAAFIDVYVFWMRFFMWLKLTSQYKNLANFPYSLFVIVLHYTCYCRKWQASFSKILKKFRI